MDKLPHLIDQEVRNNKWKAIKMERHGAIIFHPMFTDDLLLFGEVIKNQMQCVMDTLSQFCSMSGQKDIHDKTSVIFSKNVNKIMQHKFTQLFWFRVTNSFGKYLKFPLSGKKPERIDFQYIIDQVSTKLSSWKRNSPSLEVKITLAKSVIEAIPLYMMMTNRLPKSCIEEIHALQRKFI